MLMVVHGVHVLSALVLVAPGRIFYFENLKPLVSALPGWWEVYFQGLVKH